MNSSEALRRRRFTSRREWVAPTAGPAVCSGVRSGADDAVRSHWGVENGCHWTLDVTFREDESRIREKHLREDMAWLNRFCVSLLKQHPGRQSVAMKRRSSGWSDDFLMQVVIGSTS